MRRITWHRFHAAVQSWPDEVGVRRIRSDLSFRGTELEAFATDALERYLPALCTQARINGCRCDEISFAEFFKDEVAPLMPFLQALARCDGDELGDRLVQALPEMAPSRSRRRARAYARQRRCHPTDHHYVCYCDEHAHEAT